MEQRRSLTVNLDLDSSDFKSVSVERRLRTADCRLRTRGKMQTECKMQTESKTQAGCKMQNKDYRLF